MTETVKRYEVWIGDKFYGAFEKVVLAADFARLEQECRRLSDESHRNRVDLVDATERSDRLKAERDAALKQVEGLRAALEKIAAIEDRYNCGDWDEIEDAREIANAALSAKP